MTLREKQSIFMLNFAKLIIFAYENGYEITEGEGQRTKSQQILHHLGYELELDGVRPPKLIKTESRSKTLNSAHLKKLAHDIYLFKNGGLSYNKEDFKLISEYWHSLHEDNVCGYDWGWDLGHFEMK